MGDFMLKRIKDCTYNQLYSYMITNLKAITKDNDPFPYSLLMFLNNPNIKYMTVHERNEIMKKIFNELKEESSEMYIDIE